MEVRILSQQANQVELLFKIRDTGIGIPQEKLETIFEAFTQADGSTTRHYGGTGLGTTIAKKLVELMGGEIGVESRSGAGSTFWFKLRLPLQEVSSQVLPAPRHELGGRRILVLDGNVFRRSVIAEMLRSWGL